MIEESGLYTADVFKIGPLTRSISDTTPSTGKSNSQPILAYDCNGFPGSCLPSSAEIVNFEFCPVFNEASIKTLPSDLILSFSRDNGNAFRVIHKDAFCPFEESSPSVVTFRRYYMIHYWIRYRLWNHIFTSNNESFCVFTLNFLFEKKSSSMTLFVDLPISLNEVIVISSGVYSACGLSVEIYLVDLLNFVW